MVFHMPRTKTEKTPAQRAHEAIRAKYDVEYIGGVGYCGPDWEAAQAEWNAWRAANGY